MGLFVAQNGHYQGWLAALLCCFAAVGDDEYPLKKEQSRPTTRVEDSQQQPVPLTALPTLPATPTHTSGRNDKALSRDRPAANSVITDPPPSLRPLELGESLFQSPRPVRRKRESSFVHLGRSSVGAPRSSRGTQHTDGHRASLVALVPVRLGPVVLASTPEAADSPRATIPSAPASTHQRSESTQGLLTQSKRESYRAQRDSPFQRCQQISATALSTKTSTSSFESGGRQDSCEAPAAIQRTHRPSTSRTSSAGSIHKQEKRASSSERSRLVRKRSLPNVRRTSVDVGDSNVEREILELNTIVEERRAEQTRPQSPPTQHIAAIAPTMTMRARSETLDDIGSALARPLTAAATTYTADTIIPPEKRLGTSTARTSSRVSGWLTGLLPTISTSTATALREPFYKCEVPASHKARSAASSHTSMASFTELNSPSLTAASSPTTKGHGRSLTAESRLTPISPASTVYDYETSEAKKSAYEHWPVEISRSQVGLAL